jgi:branched-chain amino acid transport system substrate-binding protein
MARSRPTLGAAVVAAALVLAACSGGDDDASRRGSNPATGPPIVVGFVNQEDAPVGSFPEVRRSAEAAVRYVNEELGGVDGRPIKLETCATRGTPESSQACANQLVGKQPVAVLGGVDLGAAASLPVFQRASIPYIGGSPTLAEELTSPTAYMLAGGTVADLLAQAEYALNTLKAKRIAAIYVDLPGLLTTVVQASDVVLRSKGATNVKTVAEKADAADFTAAVTSANSSNPDVIFVVFPAQSCARIMQAAQALGVKAKMFYPGACAARSVVDAGGGGAQGAYFGSAYLPFGDRSEEVAVWRDRAEGTSVLSQAGFSVVMNLHALLGEADELTPAALVERLKAAKEHPNFMAHDYTCDRKQLPLLSSVCNPFVRILQYRDGRFDDVVGQWVSGAGLVRSFSS